VSWESVRGHDALAQAFERVVRRGRLAHAYLFVGPAGVGKRRFAGELAKALLCENPADDRLEACDECPGCQLMAAGTHPDFFAAGRPEEVLEVPIDLIRELCRDLSLKPARGRRKVAVLDDADDLSDAAANCFLKTLEEPPPGSVLILVGTDPQSQLPTIVSRCQVVRFAPLPPALVADVLREHGIDDAAQAERLARLSGGSPGQALGLADPALWDFRREILEGLSRPNPDRVGLARRWGEFVEDAGKEAAAQRRRAALVVRLLIDFFSDALRQSVGAPPRSAERGDLPLLEELGKRVDPERAVQVLERCLEGDWQIDRRAQLVLVIEALVDALGERLQAPAGAART
jgi:DNA polymerase-3 subunit delta'